MTTAAFDATIPRLHDRELAQRLREQSAGGDARFAIVADAYHAALFVLTGSTDWKAVAIGDIDAETHAEIQLLSSQSRVAWAEVPHLEPTVVVAALPGHKLKLRTLERWLKRRNDLTIPGRRGEVPAEVRAEVAALAAWHCQFHGCGQNLREHDAGGRRGNYSYFAHIVASSPDGPRGDPVLSPRLAAAPENILLLCDKCHRLIDRVDPDAYPRERLVKMRQSNISEVDRLLDGLA